LYVEFTYEGAAVGVATAEPLGTLDGVTVGDERLAAVPHAAKTAANRSTIGKRLNG
jgi:hypothetical protein